MIFSEDQYLNIYIKKLILKLKRIIKIAFSSLILGITTLVSSQNSFNIFLSSKCRILNMLIKHLPFILSIYR